MQIVHETADELVVASTMLAIGVGIGILFLLAGTYFFYTAYTTPPTLGDISGEYDPLLSGIFTSIFGCILVVMSKNIIVFINKTKGLFTIETDHIYGKAIKRYKITDISKFTLQSTIIPMGKTFTTGRMLCIVLHDNTKIWLSTSVFFSYGTGIGKKLASFINIPYSEE